MQPSGRRATAHAGQRVDRLLQSENCQGAAGGGDMRRIRVGMDGSSHAKEAARVAIGLAKRLEDTVTLAYVVPPTPVEMAISVLVDVHRRLREQDRSAEEMLRRIAAEVRDPAVAVDIHVCEGEAA